MKALRLLLILALAAAFGCSAPVCSVKADPPAAAVQAAPAATGDTVICLVDRSPAIPDRLQMKLFDTAVNTGVPRAVKILQQSLNDLKPEARLTVDGKLGPKTKGAMCGLAEVDILRAYAARQAKFYQGIVARDPGQGKFLKGWLRRAEWLPE